MIVSAGGPLAYFHNRGPAGRGLTLRLEGRSPGSNRDGVGARVTVTSGGRRRVCQRTGGGSFLSASDGRIHVGLGEAGEAQSVEVRWPSGRVGRYDGLKADGGYLLREGRPEASPLPGWRR